MGKEPAVARAYVHCQTPGCNGQGQIHERNRRTADSKAAWLEKQGWTCETCRQKVREAENAAAAAQNEARGLPTLAGSEKQVAWAETIRAKAIPEIEAARAKSVADSLAMMARELGREPTEAELEELSDAFALLAHEAIHETSARVWIDEARNADWSRVLPERFRKRASTLTPTIVAAYAAGSRQ